MGGVGVMVYTDNRCVEGYIRKAPAPNQEFIMLQFGPVNFNKDSSQHVTTGYIYSLFTIKKSYFKTERPYKNTAIMSYKSRN